VEYQRIKVFGMACAVVSWCQYGVCVLCPFAKGAGAGVGNVPGRGGLRVVFGTLLGPEATGPGFVPVFVCFWFPGCIDHAWWLSLLRGWLCAGVCGDGVVV
jgi:hypothetical protein